MGKSTISTGPFSKDMLYIYIHTYTNQLCAINGEEIYVEIEDVLSTPLPESQGFLKLGCDWLWLVVTIFIHIPYWYISCILICSLDYMNSISNEYLICNPTFDYWILLISWISVGYWIVGMISNFLGWFMEDPFPNAHNSQLKSVPIRGRDLCTDPDFHKSFRLWWTENDLNHQHYYWNLYSWSTNITDCSRSFSCPIPFSCWFFSIAPMNAPIWIWVSPPYKVVPPQL